MHCFECCGNQIRQVLGNQARPAEQVRRLAVQPHRAAGGLEAGHALRQQPKAKARQHIARPGGGKRGGSSVPRVKT